MSNIKNNKQGKTNDKGEGGVENQLIDIFNIIKTGGPAEIKEANNRLDKMVSKECRESSFFKKATPIILSEIKNFDLVKNPKNQITLVYAINHFVYKLAYTDFNTIKDFAFKIIQNPNGHVRNAGERTFDELNYYLDTILDHHPFFKGKKPNDEEVKEVEGEYLQIVQKFEDLISKYDTDEDVDYIEEMKPSVAKNLNNAWRWYTANSMYRKILEKKRPVSLKVIEMRMIATGKLESLLKDSKSEYDLDDIKEMIFDEDGHEDLMELISIFDTGEKGGPKLEDVMEAVNMAWNCFPHNTLDGACPIEKMDERLF
jgi:hypothetical protein